MPLLVECPSCSSRMNAPDKLAGKIVKCPRCQTALTLPMLESGFEVVEDEPVVAPVKPIPAVADSGFEVVEDDEPVLAPARPKKAAMAAAFEVVEDEPATAKPRKKSRPPVVVDDDEEVQEERSPRRRKKSKKGLSPAVLYGSIGGIVLLMGLAVGVYFLTTGKGGGGGLFGPSWTKFEAPDGSFSTAFPGGEPTGGDVMSMLSGPNANAQQMAQAKKAMEQMGLQINGWTRMEKGRNYIAAYVTIPPQMAALIKPDQIMGQGFNAQNAGGASLVSQEDTTVAGQKAKQILARKPDGKLMLMRYFFANNRVFLIGVEGDDGLKADDSVARTFFDKFELKSK